jgi:hypothetical protein
LFESFGQVSFFGASFNKLSFRLVSESLKQFRFGWSSLAFGYLAFWQVVFFGHC